MKVTTTKPVTQLFIQCLALPILANIVIYILYCFYPDNLAFGMALGFVQMLLGLGIGLYLRKKNRSLLLEQPQTTKRYATISYVALACLLVVIFVPDIIAMPYVYVTSAIYNLFGLDRLFTAFDFLSIEICLVSVFFNHKAVRGQSHLKDEVTR